LILPSAKPKTSSGSFAGLGHNLIESPIDNALGNRLLAALHDGIDEL
jgi:hypothetical protein